LPVERWNKFVGDIRRKPDYRVCQNGKVLYLNIDGLYYHNETRVESECHWNLRKLFEQQNLRIMQFRSDELDDSSEIIKSIVCNYFNVNIQAIRASKCTIRAVKPEHSRMFFEQNHLMKFSNKPTYGLYMGDELVAAMSYQMKDKVLEISRFCSKIYTRVHGGFSKLLSFLIKEVSPDVVVSFCDLRYSVGNSYLKVGFEYVGSTLGWRWTNGIRTYNRLKCRANMDKRQLSEKEYAHEFNWVKIYDAGQAKYRMPIIKTTEEVESEFQDDSVVVQKPTSKVFWTVEQKEFLRIAFEKGDSCSEIIKEVRKIWPDKTASAIKRKMLDMNFRFLSRSS
jgi:hypothetical protein